MGLRAINNPKSSFEDPYASTGLDAVGAPPIAGMVATGGNATNTYTDGGNKYKAHTFTTSGSLVVSNAGGYGAAIDYLVVGGGGGGTGGGGGGAGGLRTSYPGVVTHPTSPTPAAPLTGNPFVGGVTPPTAGYTVTVGPGGAGVVGGNNSPTSPSGGANGTDSYFGPVPGSGGPPAFPTGVLANGGGMGGSGPGYPNPYSAGSTGGSAGGRHSAPTAGSTGPATAGNEGGFSPVEGHAGGIGGTNYSTASGQGGGGGAGSIGGTADTHPYPPHQVPSGDGGAGIKCLIAGPTYPIGGPGPGSEPYGWFAGGGGGGANWSQGSFGGAGGYGNTKYPGGGNPGTNPTSVSPYAGGGTGGGSTGPSPTNNPGASSGGNATSATANTGGGGGGANQSGDGAHPFTGGDGGSGIVIVRYRINPADS